MTQNPGGEQSSPTRKKKRPHRRRWRNRKSGDSVPAGLDVQKQGEQLAADSLGASKNHPANNSSNDDVGAVQKPHNADAGNLEDAQGKKQAANSAKDGNSFDSGRNGKRARRRKRNRKGGQNVGPEGANTLSDQATKESVGNGQQTLSAEADSEVQRKRGKRRSKDRFKKKAPTGQAVLPQQPKKTDASTPKWVRSDAYAALDLGTNNCRLLVAVPQQPGRFRVVDAFSRIVRLGEGLASSGKLSDDAMHRAVGALKACADKLEGRSVRGVRLIATEACRRATNGVEFLKRVEQEAGLKLEIVDRETEARLAVSGCASLVDKTSRGVVLFDIGGGSSELALLDLSKRKKHDLGPAMVSWTSLPLGVVTLSEKHGGGKLVTRQVFDDMVEEVCELLETFEGRHALAEAASEGEVHLLGTSGTVTTLAGIHLALPRYDRRKVDGIWMSSKMVDQMINSLVEMSFEQRVENPCIGHDRADLVLAGCAILVAIQKYWPCPRLRVADRGLREGLLTDMMNADNAWQRRPNHFRAKRA